MFFLAMATILFYSNIGVAEEKTKTLTNIAGQKGSVVFEKRAIPEGTPLEGRLKKAKNYGYRIPSLLTSSKGTVLAFSERRLGGDHSENDIVLRRSTDSGKTWGDEIVVYEDGTNSINDPLTVQLSDGRIMMMFARFPYGRHSRAHGWVKMAEMGHDDPKLNILTFVTFSSDDGLTWTQPQDITASVKQAHWLNANSPGAMIQLKKGAQKGRLITPVWGCVPVKGKEGEIARTWEVAVVYSDDSGKTWQRTNSLKSPDPGFPNECQVAEASNGDLVLTSRNQAGKRMRKKAFSKDGGTTWTEIKDDPTQASVACMGSIISGPSEEDGSWDLYASFPSGQGWRVDGQIAVSKDHGKTFYTKKMITGSFGYSSIQISPDGKSILCLYEILKNREIRFLSIPLKDLQ